MRLVSYYPEGRAMRRKIAMGVLVDDKVAPLTDIDSFYDHVPKWKERARSQFKGTMSLAELDLAPPVPIGAKIICAAINYVAHGKESNLPTPEFPNLFARWTSELVVDGSPVPVPRAEPEGLDWEVELAAIVGDTLIDVEARKAERSMLGYTVANDISARASQVQMTKLSTGQWCLGKNPDKSGAIGSVVVTADEYSYRGQTLETRVNGQTMQSGTTDDMVFSVGDIAAFASRHVTLRPGDVLLTGTPDGVGYSRNPRILMRPGDSVTVSISGLGSVTNPIVDASHRG
ncbi:MULTISPECIES: fumarylacetoacetate hydrolase family protein [unclassified Bradyrhizobium]|uniref:fumarylacetoacetate hydrolase family protein n=1 Tax=unclassified Bradyrhizobium TaxID=2631580 RepID=UPI003399A37D